MTVKYFSKNQQEQINKKWQLNEISKIVCASASEILQHAGKYETNNTFEELLFKTMAKATINTKEVLVLLQNGFPDGALSRARNIFEQFAILMFIEKNKATSMKDVLLERYFIDVNIRLLDQKIGFNKTIFETWKKTGRELPSSAKEAQNRMKQELRELRKKYNISNGFIRDYWWAEPVIENATFHKIIEAAVDDEYLKNIYRRSCTSTHAGAYGDYALLGRDNANGNKLFVNPTDAGFEPPLLFAIGPYCSIYEIAHRHLQLPKEDFDNMSTKMQIYLEPLTGFEQLQQLYV